MPTGERAPTDSGVGAAVTISDAHDAGIDLVVVGAGPAGSMAAITAARAGLRVTVVDRATFPRDKCCGDGLTTLALRELDAIGFEPSTVPSWYTVRDVTLRSPSGREVRMTMPSGGIAAATTPRRELDAALVDAARAAGAEVVEGDALVALTQGTSSVEVTLASGRRLRAGHVIAADGMWSPTRKALGGGDGYRGEWHAFRQYVRGVTGRAATELIVWFDDDLLPGYAWSFPLPDGRANIGFGVLRSQGRRVRDMAALWRDLLARPHVVEALGPSAELEDRHTAWPIPCGITHATLADGRVLYVGDAARAGDVMTGEGIGQALVTGRLATEAVLAVTRHVSAETAAERYRRTARRELAADHRMSAVLNRALARRWMARGAIHLVGTSAWTRRHFVRWMFEDEPRAVLSTPRRWHRRLLRRPLPYPTTEGATTT